MDIKQLKNNLTDNDIIKIVESINGELIKNTSSELIFTTVCHNIDADIKEHNPKLYYYKNSHIFKCYVCGFAGDVYSLIQERWELINKEYSFYNIVDYVCDVLDIKNDLNYLHQNVCTWKNDIQDLLKNNHNYLKPYNIYDYHILDLFQTKYKQEWIDDGITLNVMKKYDIGYYSLQDCTTIPIFDDQYKLVGIHGRYWRPEDIENGKYRPVQTLNYNFKFPTSNFLYGLHTNKENIQSSKTVFIFEAPKSVMQMETIQDKNTSVALFGCNMSKLQRNLLLKYNVENFYICLDKQYKSNIESNEEQNEYNKWVQSIQKIVNLLSGFGNIYIISDNKGILNYKDSPSDHGSDIFNLLFKRRIQVK